MRTAEPYIRNVIPPDAEARANGVATRVLVAEDDPAFRTMLVDILTAWGYQVETVNDGRAALRILEGEDSPKLAILDWMMPGMDGVEVCRHIRTSGNGPYRYILLLTGRTGKQDLVEGLEAGADDYVTKPIDVHELKARLSAGRRILALQELHLSTYEVLRKQATQDPLTGLWNQAVILDILDQELARSARKGTPLGILMADLDRFKGINDTHGHLAGNVVLRETAQRIQAVLRPYDTIGRYGGEEFLIVLSGCDADTTVNLGERVRRAIADKPFTLAEGPILVTISIGTAATEGGRVLQSDTLFRAADAALYRAKNAGRNRVERGELPEEVPASSPNELLAPR